MAKLCLNLSALALAARLGAAAPHTPENAPWNVNFEKTHRPHEYYGEWPGHEYHPSPADWRSLSIYQLLTDRFADGNPRNNEALMGGFDVRDMTYRHGGDFAGLTQKLPYIRGLGCEAIWISPVFQNGENMYHQYAQHDFTLLDRRLGTLEELRNLTSAAHKLGMYVIIDVVMNHMGNEFFFEGHQYDAAPFRMHGSDPNKEYHLVPRGPEDGQFDTPVGKQPYMDFWYNNTWDKDAKYNGPVYGQYGEAAYDTGKGTYDGSDFHHNGDLKDYFKAWEIHNGKIYGSMDDLRLEHPRVMDKYIAMTKALIASADIDGFRVDTPMQVPLPFFKKWAPAMRDFAASLGKERFGIFGEFYVTSARYATMTGRGKDLNMWGTDSFIDGPATLKGGIVYSYYWYTFSAMVHNMPDLADGFPLAYKAESKMLDIYDPQSGRKEYAMWNFCNNHDNWRMQSMTGPQQMRTCLAVITFWPGVPLHYAGDEQGFNTPGSALDGWAREELGVSLAWRAVRTTPEGNPADGDSFDMTNPQYRYVQRLNALRKAYFGNFGSEECDVVDTPADPVAQVLIFTRGCSAADRVIVVANFNSSSSLPVGFDTVWPQGTTLVDALAEKNATELHVGVGGRIDVTLPPVSAMVLVRGSVKALPPAVVSVEPAHGRLVQLPTAGQRLTLRLRFDRPMNASLAARALVDGKAGAFACASVACDELEARVVQSSLKDGIHSIEVPLGQGADGLAMLAPFRSSFTIAAQASIVAEPFSHHQPGLICRNGTALCHRALGADALRIQNVGEDWSQWRDYEEVSDWEIKHAKGVLVQYHAEGSSSYVVGACVDAAGEGCFASWHEEMFLRGDFNEWGNRGDGRMRLVGQYTWGTNVTLAGFEKAKFAPFAGWSKSYGRHSDRATLYNLDEYDPRHKTFSPEPFMSGSEASRRWMNAKALWTPHESIASGAEFAQALWMNSGCTAEAPKCPEVEASEAQWTCAGFTGDQDQRWCRTVGSVGCMEYAENDKSPGMTSCGPCSCCRRKVAPVLTGSDATCCVLFHDLYLNYTLTSDLSKCAGALESQSPPTLTSTTATVTTQISTTTVHHFDGHQEGPCPKVDPRPARSPEVEAKIASSADRLTVAAADFEEVGYKRMASPKDWHSEVAYSVFVDRFSNGDITNDQANLPDFQKEFLKNGEVKQIYDWRHGGDLQGVKGRLGYLKNLGVTLVVLSPIFHNGKGDYHGFCTSDPTKVDSGFGTNELLRELVREAHAVGIRVVLDVQVNQACGKGLEYRTSNDVDGVTQCMQNYERAYWNSTRGGAVDNKDRNQISFGPDLHPDLQEEAFFAGCGSQFMYRPDGRDPLTGSHNSYVQAFYAWGDSADGSKHFNTMDAAFQEIYANMLKFWIAFADVDGFRVQASGTVSADFAVYLSTQTRHYAATLGKEHFLVVGELFQAGTPFMSQQLGRVAGNYILPQTVQGVLDEQCAVSRELDPPLPGYVSSYPVQETFNVRDMASGRAGAEDFYGRADWARDTKKLRDVIDQQADLLSSWTSVESGSMPRLLSRTSSPEQAWPLIVAAGWSMTWSGIPELFNGIEMGFNGLCYKDAAERAKMAAALVEQGIDSDEAGRLLRDCDYSLLGDKINSGFWRQDMFIGGPMRLGSAISSVQEHVGIRASLMEANDPHWCEDPLLDRTNAIYKTFQALIRIRQSCLALRTAEDQQAKIITGQSDQLAYWKLHDHPSDGSPRAVLVVLSFGAEPTTQAVKYSLPSGVSFQEGQAFVDLLNPSRMAVVYGQVGKEMHLMVPAEVGASHVAIFAPNDFSKKDGDRSWLVCIGSDLPPLPKDPCDKDPSRLMLMTWAALSIWVSSFVGVLVWNRRSSLYLCLVKEATGPDGPTSVANLIEAKHVLTAAIEHTIPERKVKVSAGGLGKVLDQMLREHPHGRLSLVHPMFGDVEYGSLDEYKSFAVVVDGKTQHVDVLTLESECDGITRTWYMLKHELFTKQSKKAPYPSPMTKLEVLRYFSLWNQCVAFLLADLSPDVYHCMDYHAALAPLYMQADRQVPMILVLHNADYMGIVETDFINDRYWRTVAALRRLSLVFNLQTATIRKYCMFEGRFNMLKAGVAFIKETQGGRGVCGVSVNYAVELKREKTLFSGLPAIMPLDNATDPADDQGAAGVDELRARRFKAKAALQKHCGLDLDPGAKILVFIGRWVKQKGVDHIAMLTPTLLQGYPDIQIVLAGPPDDACGLYAQELLMPFVSEFPGRLFVCPEFFMMPAEVRRGAHFCFAPSISEPFGYVDVEFGLLGVPTVGCAVGGLGKMPGVYFRQQNADSQQMLLEAFLCAIDHALNLPDREYWEMAKAATLAEFPFETWRANLREAYSQAMRHFRPQAEGTVHVVSNEMATTDSLKEAIAHRGASRFRRMSSARHIAQQMQILDIEDNTEFLTQAVSESRAQDIMKHTMAADRGRAADAETLQATICQAEQRLTERNHMTLWLMKPFMRGMCLRIHFVIALCYIFSSIAETMLKAVVVVQPGSTFASEYVSWTTFYLGSFVGCFVWLFLSRGIPPNQLMASSQMINVLFFVLVPSLPRGAFHTDWTAVFYWSLSGLQSASRMLFIIWNFNEDFHGGFQVACKRIGVLESLRTAVGMLSVIMNYAGIEFLHRQGVLVISLATAVALFKAPHCYCAYSLPSTGVLDGLFLHKSFWLLLVSEMLNYSANYSSQTYNEWYTLNGWANDDIIYFSLIVMLVSAILLPFIFGMLTKMSVWGPWAMRDFTCMIPPGGLLRALALYDIGYLHHRSYLFAAALIASYCIDVVRSASVFASLMTILGNKWYALKGCYMVIFLTAICSCISPYLGNWIALAMCNASVFERVTLHTSMASHKGSLGEAIFWAVVPLSALAYLFQLITLRFFNSDILTFKGNGSLLPDGSRMLHTSTRRVPISELKRIRKSGGSLRLRQSDSGEPCEQDQLDDDGCSRASGPPNRQSTLHTVVEVVGPQGDDARSQKSHHGHPPRRQSSQSGVSSHRGFSRTGSMPCSENVSEIEQTILFNLADRAGSKAGSVQAPSRASSVVSRMANVVALGEDLEMRRSASDDSREHHLIFENHPPALLREASIESASSRDSASSVDSPTVVQVSPGAEDIGRFGDICSI